ncbi:hypothetical protein [Ruania rhizosphaerae]|uniref:hypothetical protein n=1 Tax=Ruania rhizosphaerae TaxID=1840413 RepID=UPI001F3C05DD|nr:hypothetical protein [Ruania rhizosphaerae]
MLRRFAADPRGSVLDLDDVEVREAVVGNLAAVAGVRENLLEALRADPDGAVGQIPTSETVRQDYVERVCAGATPGSAAFRLGSSALVRRLRTGIGRTRRSRTEPDP